MGRRRTGYKFFRAGYGIFLFRGVAIYPERCLVRKMQNLSIAERVAAARAGNNPLVIARVPSGWVTAGSGQALPGYCVLLSDPVVPALNDLTGEQRARFLLDLTLIGDAILEVTGADRVNYMILANLDRSLHAHLHPRRNDEPADLVTAGPWAWPQAPYDPDRDGELMRRLGAAILRRIMS